MMETNKNNLTLAEALDFVYDTLGIDVYEEYEKSRELEEYDEEETDSVMTIADELRELYELNENMLTGNPNIIPKFPDGSIITQQDLAQMNLNIIERIAYMIGIEL